MHVERETGLTGGHPSAKTDNNSGSYRREQCAVESGRVWPRHVKPAAETIYSPIRNGCETTLKKREKN
ncbi:hypothetical protein J6590_036705 [Homalodisca vitripennis]|nr:hypothetical protein J6590_036705 [Homalodisca vitripennis]